jgi:hypothetical protein
MWKNKSKKLACFPTPHDAPSTHHVSPRIYHPKTTSKHPLFPAPPQKAQQSNKKNSTGPPDFFLANYGFF